ncbi:hypothetical protein [Chryseobacterium sp. M5A1_1a]
MYYVILCEASTGILLELDAKTKFIKTEVNTRPYLIFDSLDKAEKKAFELIDDNNNLEVGIYDSEWSFIKRCSFKA